MAHYYLDTSALVKLYVREQGTDWMLQIANDLEHRLTILAISTVEFRSAVRKRQRMGDIDKSVATGLIHRFEQHRKTRFVEQPLRESLLEAALSLIDRYPLRGYDAVQLAACLALKAASGRGIPIFLCADDQLLKAARSEGLTSLDPSEQDE